jgi:hypothetical protein
MRSWRAMFLVLGMLALFEQPAPAQSCRPGDIELERTPQGVRCRSRAEYDACIKKVGQDFPTTQNRICTRAMGKCFNEKKAEFTDALGLCLVSCLNLKQLSQGQATAIIAACARNCGLAETMIAYHVADKCIFDAFDDCQGEALNQQANDRRKCSQ